MRYLNHSNILQIEVTEVCSGGCIHCTRACNLWRSPQHHNLEYIEKALWSLQDWRGIVGCFGGEPVRHPQFAEICDLFNKYRSPKLSGIWTSVNDKYVDEINKTFGTIHCNTHEDDSYHQPVLLAADEMISDHKKRMSLINICWVNRYWSAIVTPAGGYFCEVAATLDKLFGLSLGVEIRPGWINDSGLGVQREKLCGKCGMCLPTPKFNTKKQGDLISPLNYQQIKGDERIDSNHFMVVKSLEEMPDDGVIFSMMRKEKFLLDGKKLQFKSTLSQKWGFVINKFIFLLKKTFMTV